MMKLADLNSLVVPWDVVINVPTTDERTVKAGFTAHFRIMDDKAVTDLAKQGDQALLGRALAGWEGVLDEDDQPLAFTEEHLEAFSGHLFWRVQVIDAYYDCLANCARKNFKRLPVTG